MNTVLQNLTVMVITHNEEDNLARTLDSLAFAGQTLVVDSCSTDSTVDIAACRRGTKVLQRKFDSFAEQCNFGLKHVETDWVLSIDADYRFPSGAERLIKAAMESECSFYEAGFDYCIVGKPIRGGILPPRVVLFRKGSAIYVNDGHGHRLEIAERSDRLPFNIFHDDRKPLSRWLTAQVTYARQEADKIQSQSLSELRLNDRIRKLLLVAPPLVFLLVYLLRGGFLSGWRGLFYALQRFTAELLLSLFLIERMIKRKST